MCLLVLSTSPRLPRVRPPRSPGLWPRGDSELHVAQPPAGLVAGLGGEAPPRAWRRGPHLGEVSTTSLAQPVEEEPAIWRTGVQAGPLRSQGHAAHLPHQTLPVPSERLPGKNRPLTPRVVNRKY